MNTIAIFHLASLTDEQSTEYLSLSKTGNPAFLNTLPIKGGLNTLPIKGGGRIRNVGLEELIAIANPVWVAPELLEDETSTEYAARVLGETQQAFTDLWAGLYVALWMPESMYQLLTKQPEFITVAEAM